MSLKTIKMIPTIFALGALGIGAYILMPSLAHISDSDNRTVTVTVTFDPMPRTGGQIRAGSALTDVVTAQIDIGPDWGPKEILKSKPLVRVFRPSKERRISVHAEQFTGKTLTCSITEKGREPVTMTKSGPSEVVCVMPGLRGK